MRTSYMESPIYLPEQRENGRNRQSRGAFFRGGDGRKPTRQCASLSVHIVIQLLTRPDDWIAVPPPQHASLPRQ